MAARSNGVHPMTVAAVCAVSLAICCGLAWWQWERFSSANGTFQNLGYVLQWPLFGLFPAFMFWRIRTLRRQAEQSDLEQDQTEQNGFQRDHTVQDQTREDQLSQKANSKVNRSRRIVDKSIAENPEEAELAAYNLYLAQLNAQDHHVR